MALTTEAAVTATVVAEECTRLNMAFRSNLGRVVGKEGFTREVVHGLDLKS